MCGAPPPWLGLTVTTIAEAATAIIAAAITTLFLGERLFIERRIGDIAFSAKDAARQSGAARSLARCRFRP